MFNGVTANEFDPVVKAADATDVVYVGEFRHIKGADLLIDAVARLRADGKPVTLTLAGDGEETENLKAQIQRLGLADAVVRTKFTLFRERSGAFAAAVDARLPTGQPRVRDVLVLVVLLLLARAVWKIDNTITRPGSSR